MHYKIQRIKGTDSICVTAKYRDLTVIHIVERGTDLREVLRSLMCWLTDVDSLYIPIGSLR